jgi:inorganic pyrophosphatase
LLSGTLNHNGPGYHKRGAFTFAKTEAALPEELLVEIEHFFISYHELKQKEFVLLGRYGPKRALKLVKKGILSAEKSQQ